jgi:hypothetical protein
MDFRVQNMQLRAPHMQKEFTTMHPKNKNTCQEQSLLTTPNGVLYWHAPGQPASQHVEVNGKRHESM